MTATAADFTWLDERFPGLAEAYCITLVRGLTPGEFMARLRATGEIHLKGAEALVEPAYDAWDEHDGTGLFIGAVAVGDWVLAVEPNGYLGTLDQLIGPLSQGTRLVSHFRNVNAVDHFHWCEDGDLRLHFEPLFPFSRDGRDPDGLEPVMRQVGFDLSTGDDRDYQLNTEAAFALAEHLTEVRLTPELLESAEFLCGTAPLPGR
ncbi:DUF6461 domain-containing protein [Streptomyces sp. H10-C2]|uniref:DUF6461 domain-containing protein n=1 Tax=unclassified Streptomyces TaxID=2593676 RepID=UPI0024B96040|nr:MULTISPECIES: DUF6461 domain-containing protein [unclassified Streptomyces]MDJ0345055.1 DUF6461 domain-containing protein [Streptomyces sp. PH10-H1]MDJ0370832.1 DUF6461 domain-containing protein [Streptomyces sp. H10-C2]